MKNKRGQFYIVAAIVIVLILGGIASIKTYAIVKPKPKTIYDLSSELKEETSRIVDYGIYNEDENLSSVLDDFIETEFASYFFQKTENAEIILIYGNRENLFAVQYDEESLGTISATIGTGTIDWTSLEEVSNKIPIEISPGEDVVEVNFQNKTYEFDLMENEMFYFVIVEERDGEVYVETN